MPRTEAPPFERGQTFYGQSPVPAIDTNNLGGVQHEGKIWEFEDIDYSSGVGAKGTRTGRMVKCMCVRNASGIALLPQRLAVLQLSGLLFTGRVDGYAKVAPAANRAYPIDEFLPAAGCPNNDMCWVVVEGPAMCLTDIAALNSIVAGDPLIAQTAATSQCTTAGRIILMDMTSLTQRFGMVGYALSAKTTNNTAASILVDVRTW